MHLSTVSPLNEMHLSTRQLTLSGRQALSPLVRLVRHDNPQTMEERREGQAFHISCGQIMQPRSRIKSELSAGK